MTRRESRLSLKWVWGGWGGGGAFFRGHVRKDTVITAHSYEAQSVISK